MKNKFVFRLLSGSLAAGALLCTLLMPGSRDESARVITASAASPQRVRSAGRLVKPKKCAASNTVSRNVITSS